MSEPSSLKSIEMNDSLNKTFSEDSTVSSDSRKISINNEEEAFSIKKPKQKKRVSFKSTLKVVYIESYKDYNVDVSTNRGCKEWDEWTKNKRFENKIDIIIPKKEKKEEKKEKDEKKYYYNFSYLLDDNFDNNFGYDFDYYLEENNPDRDYEYRNEFNEKQDTDTIRLCNIF